MKQTDEEFNAIVAEILLDDPTSEYPHIHIARKEMAKGAVQKQLENLILDYEKAEIDIDLKPYAEALSCLRKMKVHTGEWECFLEEIVQAYASEKRNTSSQKRRVNSIVALPQKEKSQ